MAVRCFPDSDARFEAFVHELIAERLEAGGDSDALLEEVRRKLAARYPRATIYPRDELAELGMEETRTWYAFRDGRAS